MESDENIVNTGTQSQKVMDIEQSCFMLSESSGSTLLLTNSSTLVSTSKPTSANVHKITPPLLTPKNRCFEG